MVGCLEKGEEGCRFKMNQIQPRGLLGSGVLCDGFCALTDSVFGELSGQK